MESTDRRQSPRLIAEESVTVTCLSSAPQSKLSSPFAARIVERSDYGMRIETADWIPPATLVRVDLADSLLLGEVAWCAKLGNCCHVGLRMEQSLQHLGDLRRLVASLLGAQFGTQRDTHSNQSEAVEAGHD